MKLRLMGHDSLYACHKVLLFAEGDALAVLAEHDELVARAYAEQLSGLLGNDHLPALAHLHTAEQVLAPRRRPEPRALGVEVDERVHRAAERVGERG